MAPEAESWRIGLSPWTLSTARSKSSIVTRSRSSRIANMPASGHIAWMSAPLAPSARAACRADDLPPAERVEPTELREELHQRALALPIPRRRDLEALRADAIQLVDEHDGGGLLAGELEELPDQAGPFTDVLLDELRAHEPDERG